MLAADAQYLADPATLVRMGTLDHRAAFLVLGIVVAAILIRRQNPLAFLAAICSVTALAWIFGYARAPAGLISAPDFSSTFLALDVRGALKLSLLPAILAILFTDFFDSLSTFIGVARSSLAFALIHEGGSSNGSAPVARSNAPPTCVNGATGRSPSCQPLTAP